MAAGTGLAQQESRGSVSISPLILPLDKNEHLTITVQGLRKKLDLNSALN